MNCKCIDLVSLRNDDTFELEDGRMLRLRIEPDIDTSINDFDCYGKTSKHSYDYIYQRSTPRPEDFDGSAEKIQVDRGAWIWWQPPAKDFGPQRGDPGFAEFRSRVVDLLQDGFCGVILELLDGVDAYSRPIVRGSASLWGIDSIKNGYLVEVLGELLAQLLSELGKDLKGTEKS